MGRTGFAFALMDSSWWCFEPIPAFQGDARFVQIVRPEPFVNGDLAFARRFTDREITSLDRYLDALDALFEKAAAIGAKGLKVGLAYVRTLRFAEVVRADAERIFLKGLGDADAGERRAFGDFMMHEICRRANDREMPFQIHTGIQARGFNVLSNTDPTHLTNLFRRYSKVRFDVFHSGYPYTSEAGLMAKYFPNVWIDMCWMTHISPVVYRRALDEYLDTVPCSKIFAWGGDHRIVDHTYGSWQLEREVLADLLAERVERGAFTERVALGGAERILGTNAVEVYGL